jgi:hypothetical protein
MIQASADAAQIRYDNSIILGSTPVDLVGDGGLRAVYPNPASATANLAFGIQRSGMVDIGIYSLQGVLVRQVFKDNLAAGAYTLPADLTDLAGGAYVVRFSSGSILQTRPLQIVR